MVERRTTIWFVFGCVLLFANNVCAGLYNTFEEQYDATIVFREFKKNVLIPLRQLGNPKIGTALNLRCMYFNELVHKKRTQRWSVEERINLSSYLIRIGHQSEKRNLYTEAEGLLRYVVNAVQRDNFLAYANLATANQLNNKLADASGSLSIGLRLWPSKWREMSEDKQKWFRKRGWNETTFAWYRRSETFHLKLLRFRFKEQKSKKIGPGELAPTPDNIFGEPGKPIQFSDENGKFVAGKIAPGQAKRVPSDAIPIVQQLLIWTPLDYRLYWLLGELYNANGDIAAAKEIFVELKEKWKSPVATTKGAFQKTPMPELFVEHFTILENTPIPKPKKDAGPRSPFNWASMAAGLGFGILIAFFVFWQLKVLGRRKQASEVSTSRKPVPIKESSEHVQDLGRKSH